MKSVLLIVAMCLGLTAQCFAQFDPLLASQIAICSSLSAKALKTEAAAQLLETEGHIWEKEEMEGLNEQLKEYDEYLMSFRSLIAYAAQIYGFYKEVDYLFDHFNDLNNQVKNHPTNALAVLLSARKNNIYQDLIMAAADIVNDLRMTCLASSKMTEKDRMEIILNIRPKLKVFNRKLSNLSRSIKYTTLTDVWLEISQGQRSGANKAEIASAAHKRWIQLGHVM